MPKHDMHSYQDCPATIARLRGDDSVHCPLISVGALLSQQEFNYYQETRGGLRHARVNDDHCGDEVPRTVVLDSASNADGFKDYGLFRRTTSTMTPWVEIKGA